MIGDDAVIGAALLLMKRLWQCLEPVNKISSGCRWDRSTRGGGGTETQKFPHHFRSWSYESNPCGNRLRRSQSGLNIE